MYIYTDDAGAPANTLHGWLVLYLSIYLRINLSNISIYLSIYLSIYVSISIAIAIDIYLSSGRGRVHRRRGSAG